MQYIDILEQVMYLLKSCMYSSQNGQFSLILKVSSNSWTFLKDVFPKHLK